MVFEGMWRKYDIIFKFSIKNLYSEERVCTVYRTRGSPRDKGVRRNDILGIYLSLFVFVMLSVKFSVCQRLTDSLAKIHIFFPSFSRYLLAFISSLSFWCLSCTSFFLCEYPKKNLRDAYFFRLWSDTGVYSVARYLKSRLPRTERRPSWHLLSFAAGLDEELFQFVLSAN